MRKQLLPAVAHLEAGLRSRDRAMPEEINRIVTDAIADLLWTPSPDADENLRSEGVADEKIDRIGNIMIDSFELLRSQIEADDTRERCKLPVNDYGVVTLHRPSNVDDPQKLSVLVDQLKRAAAKIPLVFAVHRMNPKKAKQIVPSFPREKMETSIPSPLGEKARMRGYVDRPNCNLNALRSSAMRYTH